MAAVPEVLVLPIFPLPDVTLFPHTYLPLHVFEARYRAMIVDAMARDRRLAVVGLRPGYEETYHGRPAVHAVAGAGEIVHCQRRPTGRYDIVVQGRWRVQIERELPADTLYRLVWARPLPEGAAPGEVTDLVSRVRRACGRLLRALARPSGLLETTLPSDGSPAMIADRAASAFVADAGLRQELLELVDVRQRLERVSTALEGLADDLPGGR